ncbi:MAG TPA: pyruvate dehydrogenase (acetyl-transferring), homodimeric type [Pirellulales bacterium]|nr:pyruvate dehydrogenase (acetyl-transferring), homodimeric type [Pirellulales bacterium]
MAQLEQTAILPDSGDADPAETAEWLASLRYILDAEGPERARWLVSMLNQVLARKGLATHGPLNTPYINTIPPDRQPPYPGNRWIEHRIESILRWNAMAMVSRANHEHHGIGGHISTYASTATLFEVGLNHFFRGKGDGYSGDLVYFQGHASPGVYARAFLEGRLTERQMTNFRQELAPEGGLSSYPHPWLMPDFWEFSTVSMGLGPIMAIYQARFNRYLTDRGILDTSGRKVWAFVGDGECDEPETLGEITLAAREQLDDLIFVVNCNLQRLDGPVRGNGKIIQELEGIFRGAGWNVIKVIWGGDWDALLARDQSGLLMRRMGEVVDGEFQKYSVAPGSYMREHFFGRHPELLELAAHLSDDELHGLLRGGHDPAKVYAAYKAAVETIGQPTVILAHTIKGYGLGEAGEGRNVTHQQKQLNEQEYREFRSRFGIPISDEAVSKAPFYRPPDDSPEMQYLRQRRQELGGYVPTRSTRPVSTKTPRIEEFPDSLASSGDREVSTTMAFTRHLGHLLKHKEVGRYIVPIIPDESRTFGMDGLFRQFGIYSHVGQLYEPVDSEQFLYYREAIDGQILEEGLTEAGAMSSFIAAGTAYATHGVNMMPFFIFYSMFGFQRVGDLIWAAADMRAKGFLVGATAGRTTLMGEGLQHEDGHSHLLAMAYPTIRPYDPAYAYETSVIVMDGMRRMFEENETAIYYITLHNENYQMPAMPDGAQEGIVRGIYPLTLLEAGHDRPKVQLFGSGAILREVLRAQQLLADRYQVSSHVWSVTSYTQLRREAQAAAHWNLFHPDEPPRTSYLEQTLAGHEGPYLAATDFVRAVAEQIGPWVPRGLFALGTDGLGRSDTRERLRRHFEVDAECVTLAALTQLAARGQFEKQRLPSVIRELDIDPDKIDPLLA